MRTDYARNRQDKIGLQDKSIIAKLKIGTDIRVVWLYEKGRKRLFFNDGVFIKNYGEK